MQPVGRQVRFRAGLPRSPGDWLPRLPRHLRSMGPPNSGHGPFVPSPCAFLPPGQLQVYPWHAPSTPAACKCCLGTRRLSLSRRPGVPPSSRRMVRSVEACGKSHSPRQSGMPCVRGISTWRRAVAMCRSRTRGVPEKFRICGQGAAILIDRRWSGGKERGASTVQLALDVKDSGWLQGLRMVVSRGPCAFRCH